MSDNINPETSTMTVETFLINNVRNILLELATGNTPLPSEVDALKKSVDQALDDANAQYLMQGRYRCTNCYHQWIVEDDLNDAKDCPECETSGIEPYFSGNPYAFDAAPTHALAEHERRYPSPGEFGNYTFEVHRTAVRCREIAVEDAIGPANAEIHAMITAPDQVFSSDIEVEYHAEGHEFESTVIVGEKYFWNDPDHGICSGPVIVKGFRSEHVVAVTEDGCEIEAPSRELSPWLDEPTDSTHQA